VTTGMYTRTEFESQRELSAASARAVVPLVLAHLKPTSVVDVGCGVGTWLKVFQASGITDYLGIDGHHVDADLLQIDAAHFQTRDLREPLNLGRRFDLACSLEVAEHLPPALAARFVEQLTALAPAVLFSAAVPGQTGPGHINEQWQSYWAGLFEAQGYWPLDVVRPQVWARQDVAVWYQQNTLLYLHKSRLPEGYVKPPLLDVAHPSMVSQQVRQLAERQVITGRDGARAIGQALARRLGGGS
jgi:SAM-dependent methyltransferase